MEKKVKKKKFIVALMPELHKLLKLQSVELGTSMLSLTTKLIKDGLNNIKIGE